MFLSFCKEQIDTIPIENTAMGLRTVFYRISDYLDGKDIPARMITSSFLRGYDEYLRQPTTIIRVVNNKERVMKIEPLDNSGVHTQMKRFKTLFNAVKEKYNDEEIGIIPIPNDPFKKYVFPVLNDVPDRDFTVDQISKIRDCRPKPGSRGEMVRDIWLLSFYLCGMNACDMLRLPHKNSGRVECNRKKTQSKRSDQAFFSVKLIPEARGIYDKYIGKLSYSNEGSFNMQYMRV